MPWRSAVLCLGEKKHEKEERKQSGKLRRELFINRNHTHIECALLLTLLALFSFFSPFYRITNNLHLSDLVFHLNCDRGNFIIALCTLMFVRFIEMAIFINLDINEMYFPS